MLAPGAEVRFGALCQEHAPGRFKVGAGNLQRVGGAVGAFARPASGIEATAPLSFRSRTGIADVFRDRAGVHVTVIDPPAFLRQVTIAAAA